MGSLCTGYGGLDLAIGGKLVFVSDIDKDANTVIEQRFPDVPNLGDFTQLDTLPECDVLTAGFPCQPVSQAGKRAGTKDERWLWDDIERVLGNMERPPRLLFLENVRGLLTANRGHAMARVVEGLASLGYVGSYRLVAASEVGAPHRRQRVFIVAELANPESSGWEKRPRLREGGEPESQPRIRRRRPDNGGGEAEIDPIPQRVRRKRPQPEPLRDDSGGSKRSGLFGEFWPAVERWEQIIGRPAPTPSTRPTLKARIGFPALGETNQGRLNPRFVEWMMGLPDGWVTDCGLSRTAQLRLLGNGVVPLQARVAWEAMAW